MFQVSNLEVFLPKLKLTWPQMAMFQVSNFDILPHKLEVLLIEMVLSWFTQFTVIAVYKSEQNLLKSLLWRDEKSIED